MCVSTPKLGGSGGMLPQKNFGGLNLSESFWWPPEVLLWKINPLRSQLVNDFLLFPPTGTVMHVHYAIINNVIYKAY